MEDQSDNYDNELNEAIKLSHMNFSNDDEQDYDEKQGLLTGYEKIEEEKVPNNRFLGAYQASNQNYNHEINQAFSINNTNEDGMIDEEIKEAVERLSEYPPTMAPDIDIEMDIKNCQEVLKEYIDMLDTYYPEQKDLARTVKLLKTITGNICKDPNELKYQKIRVSKIGSPPALFLLELVGFKLQVIDDDEFYVLDLEKFEIDNILFLNSLTVEKLDSLSDIVKADITNPKTTGKPTTGSNFVPMNPMKRK